MDSTSPRDPVRAAGARASADRLEARVLLGELRAKMFGQRSVATAGRFELQRLLGRGAFGAVYLAYDPTLERKVAVKLLDDTIAGPEHRARLLREAQALARLEHPNVLTVYDVTVVSGQIVIAMELVEGGTLADWCRRHPMGTRARFEALLAIAVGVGRGLAAAHDAGITHRDIKPANILVGGGRPRVADFGIARAPASVGSIDASVSADALGDAASGRFAADEHQTDLTHSRTIVGTPAFMAPEQFDGRADAASDQWGLCATLWFAAYGEPAFGGETVAERAAAVQGPPREPPSTGHGVPAWFSAILLRGLQPAPADRWPSVAALSAALEQATARQRRRRLVVSVGLLGVGGAVGLTAWGVQQLDQQRRLAACQRQPMAIDDVWNADERTELRASFVATEAGHAATTADRVSSLLDERADAWRGVFVQACRDEIRGAWDADTLDRSGWCLDDRRIQLDAVVTRLQRADVTAVTKAISAVAGLRDAAPCGDPIALSRLPMPPDGREQVAAVVAQLQDAAALEATGAYLQGLEVARAQLEPATAIGWLPLVASVQAQLGSLLTRSGQFPEAEAMLESAYFTAVEAGATEEALGAAQMLVYVVGTGLSRDEDARRWWEHAETMRTQLPDDAGLRQAVSLSNLGRLQWGKGAHAQAAKLHERALALREQALGPEHPSVANSLVDLANVRYASGAYEEAKQLAERALQLRRTALGPDHPYVAQSLSNLAEIEKALGSIDEASALHDQALQLREAALGPDHPEVAASLNNVANVRVATGAYDEAAALHRRALRIRETALGPEHPDVAQSLDNLAEVKRATGDLQGAMRYYERAIRILELARGPEHPSVAHTVNNLAIVHYARGSLDEAERLYARARDIREAALGPDHPLVGQSLTNLAVVAYETCDLPRSARLFSRSLAILEAALGPRHPDLAFPLLGLARVALAQHRVTDGTDGTDVAYAERALTLRDQGRAAGPLLAEARFVLAQSLEASGLDHRRALRLATEARDAYRSAASAHEDALAEAEAWLRRAKAGTLETAAGPCDADAGASVRSDRSSRASSTDAAAAGR